MAVRFELTDSLDNKAFENVHWTSIERVCFTYTSTVTSKPRFYHCLWERNGHP